MNKITIRRFRALLILFLDVIGMVSTFLGVFYFRLGFLPQQLTIEMLLIFILILSTLFLLGTYIRGNSDDLPSLPITTFFKTVFSILPCAILVYLLGPEKFTAFLGRGVLPVSILLFGVWATLNRFFINKLYYWEQNKSEILCLCTADSVNEFLNELGANEEIRSVIYTGEVSGQKRIKDPLKFVDISSALSRKWDEIVFTSNFHASNKTEKSLIDHRLSGTPIRSISEFYEYHWYKIPVSNVGDEWFYLTQGFSVLGGGVSSRFKRFLDVISSILLLLLTLPIIVVSMLIIRISSKGASIFKQQRVGLKGRNFTIYKLRTMHFHAEEEGPKWASQNDNRVTFVGRFLRATRIDELPQLWNVLKGDMSLVGPRPERPEFTGSLAKNIPYYDLRHLVKPGLTGWAQVMYRYGASEEDALRKLEYDLYYIKHQSFFFDFNILIRTVLVVLQQKGR